jgi:hypothetical protein
MVSMTLQVSFDQFAETAKRVLGVEEAYLTSRDGATLVTAASSDKPVVVAAFSPGDPEIAAEALKKAGFTTFTGTWLTPEEVIEQTATPSVYIAAVSYRSAEDKPGVWVDAYPSLPTQVTVLKAMYDEFRSTGQMDEIPFEDFAQLANTNVVIVSPSEIESYVRAKEEC